MSLTVLHGLDCLTCAVFARKHDPVGEVHMSTSGAGPFLSQFENNYFREMCSGSEAGSCLRLIDFVYHSTLGLRVITKKRRSVPFGLWF